MATSIFTFRERTVKNKTVGEALTAAEKILREKGYSKTCTNAISGRELSEPITVEEMSKLTEQLIDDTSFYDCSPY